MKKMFLSVIAFVSFVTISAANEISKVEIINKEVKGICNYRVKHTLLNQNNEVISEWYTYHSIEADSLEDCKAKLLAL